MNIKYRKNRLRMQLSSASEIKKAYGTNAKRISSRLDDMIASPNLSVLIQIPAANCHLLTGDRKGEWAVSISGNYRLIFEIDQNPIPKLDDGSIDLKQIINICILDIVDYH